MLRGLIKFAFILAILGAMYEIRYYMAYMQVEKHSLFFVTDAINRIGEKWDEPAFEKMADNSLKISGTIKSSFESYAKLGTITKPASCELQEFQTYKYQGTTENYISASYHCKAQFQNGPADLNVSVVRFQDTDEWKFGYFSVDSTFFSEPVPDAKADDKDKKPGKKPDKKPEAKP